jgi:excisionase family DNA binding protein
VLAEQDAAMKQTSAKPAEPLADQAEVAAFLKIPERTVEQWRWAGTGPAWRKIGRHVRYDWAEVRAWVAAQTKTA